MGIATFRTWGLPSNLLHVASRLKIHTKIQLNMGFGDLKAQTGLKALNDFLADRSYIDGYVPSQADVAVYEAVGKAPAASLAHVLRWFNQMASYKNQSSLPGVKKPVDSYGPAGGKAAPAAAADDDEDEDDDDFDMFGSDDEETKAIKEKRLQEYAEKKAKKPQVIAKSNVILDVKPWDDETDMKQVEANVRTIEMEGLLWGSSTLVEVGYGIKKLRITTVVVDSLVSIEELTERIADENEDLVQSVDIAAFNKI